MLHLHFSNRFETLAEGLLSRLVRAPRGGAAATGPRVDTRADPLASAFAADAVIVPSAAVQRALTLAIADAAGVCAQVRFDYLARWLWRQIGRVVPGVAGDSPFDATGLAWRAYRAFGDADFVAAHPRLAAYLGEADDVMRLELAERSAALLAQYVTYRDDWLDAWRRGRPAVLAAGADATARADEARQAHLADEGWQANLADEGWQANLWRRLAAELGLAELHPAAAFAEALRHASADSLVAAGVPAVTHVIALPTMAPLHIEGLLQLGRVVDIHLHVLNPCQEYWFELVAPRRLGHLALRGRDPGHEVGNRLLASWGRQTQSQIDLLIDRAGDAMRDDGAFVPNPAPTLLAQVQNAILELTELEPGSLKIADTDRSLELHVCHTLTRELEVLHDHLLGLFAADAQRPAGAAALRPADILVVVPDLEAAAPRIDAVFGSAPAERAIPYTVTGRARSRVNVPARALLDTLALAGSRFAASAVYGLLQQPIVARRFGLDDTALQQVHAWMRDSGMRWGLDAAHRASVGLPGDPNHTLADGFDRLFLGHALPSPDEGGGGAGVTPAETLIDAGRLPAGGAEGTGAFALGAFWRCVTALGDLRRALAVPQPPAAWAARLLGALETLLAPVGDELDDLRELQAAIRQLGATLRAAGLEREALPLAVVRRALEQALDEPARGGVPTGNVTFASMSALRGLPFRVVCVLGLDDGAFPSAARAPEFDLMALQPRRGDRQRRDDERNLFLDLLLAARDSLYLSHTGRSVRDNAPRPPSVLVAELLDTVLPALAGDPGRARARLVVEHPLQPFSITAFSVDADPRLRSFNRELGEALQRSLRSAAVASDRPAPAHPHDDADAEGDDDHDGDQDADQDDDAATASAGQTPFFIAPLPPPGPPWREVSLAQLAEFFRQPSRYLLRRRLGIDLPREADALVDDEPFLPDHDGRRALAQRLLPALLSGADAADLRALARAGTELPRGALGERQLQRELDHLARFAARVRAATTAAPKPPHLSALTATLDGDTGPETWRLHGAFTTLRADGAVRWACTPLRAGDALDAWLHHLALCATPAPGVASQTRWLLADRTLRLTPPDDPAALLHALLALYRRGLQAPLHFYPKAAWAYAETGQLRAAEAVWAATPQHPHGESADPYHRLALRGVAEPLDAAFEALALAVLAPLRAHLVEEA